MSKLPKLYSSPNALQNLAAMDLPLKLFEQAPRVRSIEHVTMFSSGSDHVIRNQRSSNWEGAEMTSDQHRVVLARDLQPALPVSNLDWLQWDKDWTELLAI